MSGQGDGDDGELGAKTPAPDQQTPEPSTPDPPASDQPTRALEPFAPPAEEPPGVRAQLEEPRRRHRAGVVAIATIAALPLSAVISTLAALAVVLATSAGAGAGASPTDPTTAETIREALTRVMSSGPLSIPLAVAGSGFSFLVLSFILGARAPGAARPAERFRLAPTNRIDVVLAVVGMLALANSLDDLLWLLGFSDVGSLKFLRDALASMSTTERLMVLPFTGVLAGFSEELFFRGWGLTKSELAIGRTRALIYTSLLFGLIHLDPVHAPTAAVMGLFLGWVVLVTGSVWPTIIAHVVNNSIATLAPRISHDAPEARVVSLLLGLAATVGVLLMLRRRHPEAAPAPDW